jgi:drug/metabolite transporter (DMT)-like permease
MLNKMAPFFAVIASVFLLREKLSGIQIFSLLGAFTGALLVIKPTFSNMDLIPALVGFAGGVTAGIAYTIVRMLGQRGERGSFIVFFFSLFSSLVALPTILFDYTPMTLSQTLWLLGAGLCAAGGQFSVTGAYRCAPAREISVYDYSQVIFAAVLGFFLFGDRPDLLSVLGYIIICSMAVMNFLHNKKAHHA